MRSSGVGGVPPLGGPSQPQPGGADVTPVALPPNNSPPYGFRSFNVSNNQVIGPGPVTTVLTNTFRLPQGSVGVIRGLIFLVNNLLLTSQINFAVQINSGSVEGYDNYVMPQAGMAVYVDNPDNAYIDVPDNAIISVAVTVTDAVAYAIYAQVRGWYYSKSVADKWARMI